MVFNASIGRDLSTPTSAFHSDTFISVHGACPDRPVSILSGRFRPSRDPVGTPLRSAPHLPTFKPSPLFSPPLYISTSSLPWFTIALSSRPDRRSRPCRDHHCFKSFSCNTYGSPRKCCKQKTYFLAKPFRCNTYKKQGVGQSRAIFHLTVQLSTVDCQPLPPCSSTDHRTRITTDDSLLVVSCG
jgi:hypothetical protein